MRLFIAVLFLTSVCLLAVEPALQTDHHNFPLASVPAVYVPAMVSSEPQQVIKTKGWDCNTTYDWDDEGNVNVTTDCIYTPDPMDDPWGPPVD